MVLRLAQAEWRKQMCKDHKCFRKFIGSLNAESSRETYGYKIQKFMKFVVDEKLVKHKEDFESLLKLDTEQITDVLEDYVFFLQDTVLSGSKGDRIIDGTITKLSQANTTWRCHGKTIRDSRWYL